MTFLSALLHSSLLQTVVTVAVISILLRSLYRALTGPLSSIPGPLITKWTDLPVRLAVLSGTRAQYVHALHQRYGPVVRLGPNDADVSDPDAVREIYRTKNPFIKSSFYKSAAGFQSMFATRDPHFHAQSRRLLGPYFAENFLRTLEPIVMNLVRASVRGIVDESKSAGCADLLKWWTLLAMDVIGEVSFGESFDLLKTGKKSQYANDVAVAGAVIPLWTAFPILMTAGRWFPFIPFFSDAMKSLQRVIAVQKARVGRYLQGVATGETRRTKTLFEAIVKKGEESELSPADVTVEVQSYVTAGTDTTAVTLTYLVWAICKHRTVQEKLSRELQSLPDDFGYAQVRDLPYLNCVLDEALRYYGAGAGSLPREVPAEGADLGGYHIPGGVIVAAQAYSVHRNPQVFREPLAFDPSRWEEPTKQMKDNFLPFSIGPRSCVGQHLARMQMRLATAMLFRAAPNLQVSTKHGMSDADMEQRSPFLFAPKGHRCLVEV